MNRWPVDQMDVIAAYLNGTLNEEIYMIQPPGFEKGNLVCRLIKGLYGLKQSGRVWYQQADNKLKELGFSDVVEEPGLYCKSSKGLAVIICLYVDDIVITAATQQLLDETKAVLKKAFKMTDSGPISFILSVEVTRSRKAMLLTQGTYIKKLLQRFSMQSSHPARTPLPITFNATLAKEQGIELQGEDAKLYRSIVGPVMYAARGTRPDIAFSVELLSRWLDKISVYGLGTV